MIRIPVAIIASSLLACATPILAADSPVGTWTTVAAMKVTREYPGLAVMPDGRILAVTGHFIVGHPQGLASAELYDVDCNEWTPTGSMNLPRNGVQPGGLMTLPSGKVLITGGGSGSRSVHETERYDYDTGKWTSTGSMSVPRCVHTTTLLDSGLVLATGGIDWVTEEVHDTAEAYDHKTGTWSSAGKMHTPRFNHRAVKLADGNVLVVGGLRDYPGVGHAVADAEIYDVKTGAWRKTASMESARRSLAAVLLKDGRVLVVGGASNATKGNRQLSSAEIFDPESEKWTAVAPLREARWGPTIDLLRDGRVLITGGAISPIGARKSAELFDPQQGKWSDAGNMSQARNGHRSIMLPDGRVMIVGGHFVGKYLSSCEIYSPE
jgi:hypothetical protein